MKTLAIGLLMFCVIVTISAKPIVEIYPFFLPPFDEFLCRLYQVRPIIKYSRFRTTTDSVTPPIVPPNIEITSIDKNVIESASIPTVSLLRHRRATQGKQ